jgi:ligand-binding sensor domain-containing protein
MKLFRLLICLIYFATVATAFFCTPCAHAFNSDDALSSLLVTSWSKRDGLPHALVRTSLQDSDGYLWIGTQSGLSRFDGRKFVIVIKHFKVQYATTACVAL